MKEKLTALEWEIMNHVWESGNRTTVREIVDRHYADGSKAYTTVQTVMNKLVQKGYLKVEKIGMVNHYTPLKKKDQLAKAELKNIIEKVFNGSTVALVNSLFSVTKLSEKELQELKNIINENEKKGKNK
jgi:predicted transcriptional regulator